MDLKTVESASPSKHGINRKMMNAHAAKHLKTPSMSSNALPKMLILYGMPTHKNLMNFLPNKILTHRYKTPSSYAYYNGEPTSPSPTASGLTPSPLPSMPRMQ